MYGVDLQPVDLGAYMRKGVQPRLRVAPVVGLRPLCGQPPHVSEWDTLRPVVHGLRLGPPCVAQTVAEVVELRPRDRDGEILDARHDHDRALRSEAAGVASTNPAAAVHYGLKMTSAYCQCGV